MKGLERQETEISGKASKRIGRAAAPFLLAVLFATSACGGGGSTGTGGGVTGSTSTAVKSVASTVNQSMNSGSSSGTAVTSTSAPQPFNLTAFVRSQILLAKQNGSGPVSRISGPALPLLARSFALLDPAEIRSFSSNTINLPCSSGSGTMTFTLSGSSMTSSTMSYSNCTMGGTTMNGTMTMSYSGTTTLTGCGTTSYMPGPITVTITYGTSFTITTSVSTSTLSGSQAFSNTETCNSGTVTLKSVQSIPSGSTFTITTSNGTITLSNMSQTMIMILGSNGGPPSSFQTYGTLSMTNTALAGTPFSGTLTIAIGTSTSPWMMDMAGTPPYPTSGSITVTDPSTGNSITITAEPNQQVQVVQVVNGTTTTTTESWSSFV